MKRLLLTSIAALAVGLLAGLWLGETIAENRTQEADTTKTTVVDTIPYYFPVPKDSVIQKFVYCKLPVAETARSNRAEQDDDTAALCAAERDADTAHIFYGAGAGGTPRLCDSATVVVPIEQKVYEDSTYKAWISGYMVSLDRIDVYERSTMIRIREEKPPNRFGIGVTAGYGYGKGGFTPFIGVGLTYNIIPLRRIRKAQ